MYWLIDWFGGVGGCKAKHLMKPGLHPLSSHHGRSVHLYCLYSTVCYIIPHVCIFIPSREACVDLSGAEAKVSEWMWREWRVLMNIIQLKRLDYSRPGNHVASGWVESGTQMADRYCWQGSLVVLFVYAVVVLVFFLLLHLLKPDVITFHVIDVCASIQTLARRRHYRITVSCTLARRGLG